MHTLSSHIEHSEHEYGRKDLKVKSRSENIVWWGYTFLWICENSFIDIYEKALWEFDGDYIESVDQFKENWHLNNIDLPNYEPRFLCVYLGLL